MLVTFKTISQVSFTVEVEPAETIGDIKKKIAAEKGEAEYPVDGQKLIYNGKVLEDTQTVEEVKIDPAKFVVVMVARKKAAPVVTPEPSVPATTAAPTPAVASNTETPQAPATAAAPSNPVAPPSEALTPEQEGTVQAIVAMGYPRDRVLRALRASFFNGDRAVEYLCSGIPDEEEIAAAAQEEGETDESTGGEEMTQSLEFLRQLPQFGQLRDLVQMNPSLLPQIIQQIAQRNPAFMEAIQNNPEEFINLLNEQGTESGGGGGGGGGQGGQHRSELTRGIAIEVTAAERDAIDRLKAMGFPEQLVIEAYFACDKNEDLAVNYILARMDEAAAELDALEHQGQQGGGQ